MGENGKNRDLLSNSGAQGGAVQAANDNDTQLVGAVLWAVWCLTLSMGALGMTYLGRAAWRMWLGS